MIKKHPLILVTVFMLFIIFLLPLFSDPHYSVLRHTTSHLGAQHTRNAWIMNTTFVLLGLTCIIESWIYIKRYPMHQILLIIFGLSLILNALFNHAPIDANIPFNNFEDLMHSIFASVVGFSFTLLSISSIFIEQRKFHRFVHLFVSIFVTMMSILIFNVESLAGLWQRFIFMVSFPWIIYFVIIREYESNLFGGNI